MAGLEAVKTENQTRQLTRNTFRHVGEQFCEVFSKLTVIVKGKQGMNTDLRCDEMSVFGTI